MAVKPKLSELRRNTSLSRQTGRSLLDVVVAIVVLALIALVVNTTLGARRRAARVICRGNLIQLGITAGTYAEKHDGKYPLASGDHPRAFESLNLLAQEHPELASVNFVCPRSQLREAEETNGSYQLEAHSNSYAWIGLPTLNTDNPKWPLGSDLGVDHASLGLTGNHRGGMNVVFLGGSSNWISLRGLPEGWLLPERLVDNSGQRPRRP